MPVIRCAFARYHSCYIYSSLNTKPFVCCGNGYLSIVRMQFEHRFVQCADNSMGLPIKGSLRTKSFYIGTRHEYTKAAFRPPCLLTSYSYRKSPAPDTLNPQDHIKLVAANPDRGGCCVAGS